MTIEATPLPPFTTVLGAMDQVARASAADAKNHGLAAVRSTFPARSHRLIDGQRASVVRTTNGYAITIRPNDKLRYPNGVTPVQVAGWVSGGTGEFGPRRRAITPRKGRPFRLPNGWSSGTIKGQRPQHLYERVQASEDAAVLRIFQHGAQVAAREAERVIGGRR